MFLSMNTVKVLGKTKTSSSERKKAPHKGKSTDHTIEEVDAAVQRTGFSFWCLFRPMMQRLARYVHRGKWVSLQFFELGSLVNLYLTSITISDPQIRKAKLEYFIHTASRVLRAYKLNTYLRFKKTVSPSRKTPTIPTTLQKAVTVIYDELKILNRIYRRRCHWKQIRSSAASLIRDQFTRH